MQTGWIVPKLADNDMKSKTNNLNHSNRIGITDTQIASGIIGPCRWYQLISADTVQILAYTNLILLKLYQFLPNCGKKNLRKDGNLKKNWKNEEKKVIVLARDWSEKEATEKWVCWFSHEIKVRRRDRQGKDGIWSFGWGESLLWIGLFFSLVLGLFGIGSLKFCGAC